ncbi:MAG TPA: RNA methyltransferase [Erysipelothrix sp.]|nr:RNA methyltransferase [Erysipelothrix sp.]
MIYEGFLAVKAILENKERQISTLFVLENKFSKQINYCRALAHQRNIPIQMINKVKLDQLAQGKTHGGILLQAQPTAVIDSFPNQLGYWALVEGVEDPYNLGAIMRTLYCAGYDGLLTNQRDFEFADPIIVKASGGASEKIPWIQLSNTEQGLALAKSLGHRVIVTHRQSESKPYYDLSFKQPHVLCIGGEMRGLSKQVLDCADEWCVIPYGNQDARLSLNAVSALAILSFEKGRK